LGSLDDGGIRIQLADADQKNLYEQKYCRQEFVVSFSGVRRLYCRNNPQNNCELRLGYLDLYIEFADGRNRFVIDDLLSVDAGKAQKRLKFGKMQKNQKKSHFFQKTA
jgi:hypothetical protein